METTVAQGEGERRTAQALAGKYLTFKLDAEAYGLEILKVQEIIGLMSVTHVPRTPEFVRGVINLRGKVIPVVDLRLKFGMHSQQDTERTCVIVVRVHSGSEQVIMGLVVDEVSEVLDVLADQIEPPPTFGSTVDTAFLLGIGKVGEKVVILLDVEKVLSGEDLSSLGQMA